AMSIDDVINNANETTDMPVQVWLGDNQFVEVWSDDGTFAGGNLEVKYHSGMNAEAGPVAVSNGLELTMMGDVAVYTFVLPDGIDMPEQMMFLFEESTLESTDDMTNTYLRMGYVVDGMGVEQVMLFNDVAKDDVLMHFAPMKPVSDKDYDGWDDDMDNCPEHYNPQQHDQDGNGIGDLCDFNYQNKDYDQDGWLDGEDNCPVVKNEDQLDVDENGVGDACEINGEADTDGDGIEDYMDSDIDGDGVMNDEDMDIYNPWIGKVVDEPDFDEDGIPDYMDDDIDNDGVLNEDDADDYDDMVWDRRQFTDLDGDGVMDYDDNCIAVMNDGQEDADDNGLGDACDIAVSDISGLWHGKGQESFSDISSDMTCDMSGMIYPMGGLGKIEMEGNQFFVFDANVNDDRDDDMYGMEGIEGNMGGHMIAYGVLAEDGSYMWYEMKDDMEPNNAEGTDDGMSENIAEDGTDDTGSEQMAPMFRMYMGQYDELSDTMMHSDVVEDTEKGCVVTTTMSIERPDMSVNEETAFMAGLSWFDSFNYIEGKDFEYGTIIDAVDQNAETMYRFDLAAQSWLEHTESYMQEFIINDSGVMQALGNLTFDGYGSEGHTAMLNVDGSQLNIDLQAIDLSGMQISHYLHHDYKAAFTNETFSDDAIGYVANVENVDGTYRFWCDQNMDMIDSLDLECANAIVLKWQENEFEEVIPVIATSIDDIISNKMLDDENDGFKLYLEGDMFAEFWSDDGTIMGGNLTVTIFKHGYNDHGDMEKLLLGEGLVLFSNMGGFDIFVLELPDHLQMMRNSDMFLFVENVIESDGKTVLRQGHYESGTENEMQILFNTEATADILLSFNIDHGPDMNSDMDLDGIVDYMDNCVAYANEDQIDSDGNGVGDMCQDVDFDNDGVDNSTDNCSDVFNPNQEDFNLDGLGDACSDFDSDGYTDEKEIIDGTDPEDEFSFPQAA
ncbi:thrombospondin type 3 repeat-containing protein, partial [Psychrosphaera sp. 1_MG-2023]|uniref:thrombospondin type 3 repeat-containing protein n=1 Tax=Psychrosphaera sp. 1_MG-2023 TaxID=3062643 RepID=UPI0026E20B2E